MTSSRALWWVNWAPSIAVACTGFALFVQLVIRKRIRLLTLPLIAIAGYMGWAVLSTTWSVSSTTTIRAVLIDAGITAFGCWFALSLTFAEQVWSVCVGMWAAVIASAWAIEYRPRFSKMYLDIGWAEADAPWQGIFGNRNSLAPVCVLGLLGVVGCLLLRPSVIRALALSPLVIVHVVLLHRSGGLTSTLSLGLIAFTAAVIPLMWFLRRRGFRGSVIAAGAVGSVSVGIGVLMANFDRLVTEVGRDPALTGRRSIWADVRSFIRDRPYAGAGYGAFWDRSDLTAASYARLGPYASAHNSALEVALGLGLIGLILFLIVCLSAIVGISQWIWKEPSKSAWWWGLVMVFLIAHHTMESFVLWHSYMWVLLVAAANAVFGVEYGMREAGMVEFSWSSDADSPDDHTPVAIGSIPLTSAHSELV